MILNNVVVYCLTSKSNCRCFFSLFRKMYRCEPYADYKSTCSTDEECGINEYCAPLVSECRTKLPDGSICLAERECLNHCSGGVCSKCVSGKKQILNIEN